MSRVHAALAPVSLSALLMIGLPISAQAESVTEKARRDEVARVARTDALMEAAKKLGRATLPEFLTVAKAPKEGMRNFAVKVGLPANGGLEYVWVRPFESMDGRHFSGQLRNAPQGVAGLKLGDTIAFDENDIVDWTYFDGPTMKGNFTACALLLARPKSDRDAFKKQYGLDCEQ
jgi:uncharacterized protein YegJ (DUF2314 family)